MFYLTWLHVGVARKVSHRFLKGRLSRASDCATMVDK